MDWARSCYYSVMRLYRDRPDILVLGHWRFCQPSALPLPFAHRFGSHEWDWKNTYVDPLIGEVPLNLGWSDGASDRLLTGQHYCGDERVWNEGILYDERPGLPFEDGYPTCCKVTVPRLCLATEDGKDIMVEAGDACLSPESILLT